MSPGCGIKDYVQLGDGHGGSCDVLRLDRRIIALRVSCYGVKERWRPIRRGRVAGSAMDAIALGSATNSRPVQMAAAMKVSAVEPAAGGCSCNCWRRVEDVRRGLRPGARTSIRTPDAERGLAGRRAERCGRRINNPADGGVNAPMNRTRESSRRLPRFSFECPGARMGITSAKRADPFRALPD